MPLRSWLTAGMIAATTETWTAATASTSTRPSVSVARSPRRSSRQPMLGVVVPAVVSAIATAQIKEASAVEASPELLDYIPARQVCIQTWGCGPSSMAGLYTNPLRGLPAPGAGRNDPLAIQRSAKVDL